MWFGVFDFHARETPPSSTDLASAYKPYIETCIEAFGVNRSMFQSNFPPDGVSSSYPILWNAFKRLAVGYSASEKTELFSGTAKRLPPGLGPVGALLRDRYFAFRPHSAGSHARRA
jgi:hypothetical protein